MAWKGVIPTPFATITMVPTRAWEGKKSPPIWTRRNRSPTWALCSAFFQVLPGELCLVVTAKLQPSASGLIEIREAVITRRSPRPSERWGSWSSTHCPGSISTGRSLRNRYSTTESESGWVECSVTQDARRTARNAVSPAAARLPRMRANSGEELIGPRLNGRAAATAITVAVTTASNHRVGWVSGSLIMKRPINTRG